MFGEETEALTHSYLARAWAKREADLRRPGASGSDRFLGDADSDEFGIDREFRQLRDAARAKLLL
jgi:hypothetical protein